MHLNLKVVGQLKQTPSWPLAELALILVPKQLVFFLVKTQVLRLARLMEMFGIEFALNTGHNLSLNILLSINRYERNGDVHERMCKGGFDRANTGVCNLVKKLEINITKIVLVEIL